MNGREPFLSAAGVLLRESGCTVRKWNKKPVGRAYTREDDWGIEVPEPRGPISFGTFAHEIGHQLLHRFNSDPRWLEEVEAWEYALAQFERFDLPGVEECRRDAGLSLVYAAAKAERRSNDPRALMAQIRERYPEWVWELGIGCLTPSMIAHA